jgi:hypothetical protein
VISAQVLCRVAVLLFESYSGVDEQGFSEQFGKCFIDVRLRDSILVVAAFNAVRDFPKIALAD